MKVLITGRAGFLGSHLCEILIQYDNEVMCVDNLLTGKKTGHKQGQGAFGLGAHGRNR